MKLKLDLVIEAPENDLLGIEIEETVVTVPFLVDESKIIAAHPDEDHEVIHIYFGSWIAVKYSKALWQELERRLINE